MAKRILRYEIGGPMSRGQGVYMPIGAEIKQVLYQDARKAFSVYAEVEENSASQQTTLRQFLIHSTGARIAANEKWVASVVMPDGFHVWHIYEVA